MNQEASGRANGAKIRRSVKDSVFTDLFSDKENILRLYRELHPEDAHVTEDDISDVICLDPNQARSQVLAYW